MSGAARTRFARLSGVLLYLSIPALDAMAPLLVVPTITSRFGAGGWGTVAIATSIGTAGGVIAELGWGVVGPQEVARDPASAHQTYVRSYTSKLVALAILVPISGLAAALLTPDDRLAGCLVAIGTVIAILTPAWFFIGMGRPLVILSGDTIPSFVILAASAGAILLGFPLWTYGFALVLANVLVVLLSSAFGRLPLIVHRSQFGRVGETIRRQLVVVVGRIVSTIYTALPTTVLAIVAPGVVPSFSAVDKPMRLGIGVLAGVPLRLQSWLGTPDRAQVANRSRMSLLINAGLGALAGLIYIAAAPLVLRFLFTGAIHASFALIVLEGILAAIICASRGFGLSLVAFGRANAITTAITSASITGAVGLFVLPEFLGAEGTVIALICAELVGLGVQAAVLRRAVKRHGRSSGAEVASPAV